MRTLLTAISGIPHHPARRERYLPIICVLLTLACASLAPRGLAHAQQASPPAQNAASGQTPELEFRIPAPANKDQTLIIRIQVEQPYIDDVATRVTYDGWQRMFGIEWQARGKSGRLLVADASVTQEQVFADILDGTRAGVSVPERYTPLTAPRLLPYLLAVRDKWGRTFDAHAHASAGIAVIAMVASMRPAAGPVVAPTVTTAAKAPPPVKTTSEPALPPARVTTATRASSKPVAASPASSAATPSGVWSRPPVVRGREIEKAFGSNLVDNFPVIDRFENGIATSIKSVDLGARSYHSTSVLTSTVKGYIDKLARFKGEQWAGRNIRSGDIEGRALELVIPTSGTAAQQAALKKLVAHGHSVGVEVKIIVYP